MSSYGFGPNWQAELPHHFAGSSVAPRVPCASNVYDEPAIGYHQTYHSAYASPTRHYSSHGAAFGHHQHAGHGGHHGHPTHLHHGSAAAHDGYASGQSGIGAASSFHLNPHAVAPSASPGAFHGHGLSITNLLQQSQQAQHLAHLPHSQTELQASQQHQRQQVELHNNALSVSPPVHPGTLAASDNTLSGDHGQHLPQPASATASNYSSPSGAPASCKLSGVTQQQRQQLESSRLDAASVHSDSATTASSRGQTAAGSPYSAESPSKTPEPTSNGSGDPGSKQYYPWMKSYTGKNYLSREARACSG